MFGRKKVTAPGPAPQQQPTGNDAPLHAAANYIGCVSPPDPIYIDGLHDPSRCMGPNDEMGVCYLFKSSIEGSGKIYFFPSFSSVWVDGEPGPRAQIPTDMIANRVPRYVEGLKAALD